MFTGDLAHTTDDRQVRRAHLDELRDIVSELQVNNLRFLPGKHDAALDRGEVYQEFSGSSYYTFDH